MSGRTSVISFRVTDAERERIELRAKAKNLKPTVYARELVTGFDPDAVAIRSRATVEQQEQALASLSDSVKGLEKDVRQVGKRLRSDLSFVIVIIAIASLALLGVGASAGYAVALLVG